MGSLVLYVLLGFYLGTSFVFLLAITSGVPTPTGWAWVQLRNHKTGERPPDWALPLYALTWPMLFLKHRRPGG